MVSTNGRSVVRKHKIKSQCGKRVIRRELLQFGSGAAKRQLRKYHLNGDRLVQHEVPEWRKEWKESFSIDAVHSARIGGLDVAIFEMSIKV